MRRAVHDPERSLRLQESVRESKARESPSGTALAEVPIRTIALHAAPLTRPAAIGRLRQLGRDCRIGDEAAACLRSV